LKLVKPFSLLLLFLSNQYKNNKMFHMPKASTGTLIRGFSSLVPRNQAFQVMVSQSRKLLENTALEEWIRRRDENNDTNSRKILLLSANCTRSGNTIKAFVTGGEMMSVQTDLVLQSIPLNAALQDLPEVHEEDDHVSISLPMQKGEDSLAILQNIANRFMANQGQNSRLSLVRPERDWFPGIEEIQEDMQRALAEISAIRRSKEPAPQTSYGAYF